jgi:hypothetical protein
MMENGDMYQIQESQVIDNIEQIIQKMVIVKEIQMTEAEAEGGAEEENDQIVILLASRKL